MADRHEVTGWLRRLRRNCGALLFVSLFLPALVPGAAAQMPPPSLSPHRIAMGTFYDGSRVEIRGTAPAGSGILVVFRGSEEDQFFDCKGREGFIWLNADKIHVKGAPSLFLTFGSARLPDLLDRASRDRWALGPDALAERIRCLRHCKCNRTGNLANQDGSHDQAPDPAYATMLLSSFFALREHQDRYAAHAGTVHLAEEDGATRYSLEADWPKSAPPGKYRVEVYACRDHGVIARAVMPFDVVEIGFPASMASLSVEHRWAYGVCAVLAAMLAGFGIDWLTSLFRRPRSGPGKDDSPLPPPNADETAEPKAEAATLPAPASHG